jgi:hypothetical protein
MHEIFIVCFYTYFCVFQSLIDTKHSAINIFSNSSRYSKFFDNSPILPKARRIAERCRRKRRVKFSVVFVTVRFRIVLSDFSEKEESNFAFSRSYSNRCWRKRGVKLCAFGSIQHIQRRSGITRFWRISGVKRCVFAENAE